jgi:glycosyltransferase involved in cell wall biosynthesis
MPTPSSNESGQMPNIIPFSEPTTLATFEANDEAQQETHENTAPTISIGMPVYNAERYLVEALDSLLDQTFTDFEIIISDNSSTDQTESICFNYVRLDSRISYVRQSENLGATANFNHVFGLARGRYFKWASYDDICKPDFLAKCVEVLDNQPEVVWVHCSSGKIDEHGEVLDVNSPEAEGIAHSSDAGLPRQSHDSKTPHLRFQGVLLGTNWCVDSYGLIRSDALQATRLLPACYGAEKVLMGALSLSGCYYEIPETLFHQRVHPTASSRIGNAAKQRTFMDAKSSSRFSSTRMRLLSGHFHSIASAQLTIWQRIRCVLVIGKYLLQTNKWKSVFANTLTGTGVGRIPNSEVETDSNCP